VSLTVAQLGKCLGGIRYMRGFNQAQVAAGVTAAGKVTLSIAQLSAIESGHVAPRVDVLWAILAYLQVPEDVLWALVVGLPAWVPPPTAGGPQ
jgi:transcriptional regulator with XRE-family HTH domain